MNEPLVIFDGVCNLCNFTVNYIIKRDKKKIFRFSNFQSNYGREVLLKYNLAEVADSTVVLICNEKIYLHSSAILKIIKLLRGYESLIALPLNLIHPSILNFVYKIISANRYKWFGRKDTCLIPAEEIMNRFIL